MEIIKHKDDIISYEGFISQETCKDLIDYFESAKEYWDLICFFNSYGMSLVPDNDILEASNINWDILNDISDRMQECINSSTGRPLKRNSIHAQKWEVGSFAMPHSDNSDLDGNPNGWRDNKYVSILYLNEEYEGGVLTFDEHGITLKPKAGTLVTFPGGIENLHSVTEVTDGLRYTIVSFWDFADIEYSEEEKKAMEDDIAKERVVQAEKKEVWKTGVWV